MACETFRNVSHHCILVSECCASGTHCSFRTTGKFINYSRFSLSRTFVFDLQDFAESKGTQNQGVKRQTSRRTSWNCAFLSMSCPWCRKNVHRNRLRFWMKFCSSSRPFWYASRTLVVTGNIYDPQQLQLEDCARESLPSYHVIIITRQELSAQWRLMLASSSSAGCFAPVLSCSVSADSHLCTTPQHCHSTLRGSPFYSSLSFSPQKLTK